LVKVKRSKGLEDIIKYYLRQDLCLIPCKYKSKEPTVSWKEYQQRKPSEAEINEWFYSGANYNVGIVCGKVSNNLVVVDIDNDKKGKIMKIIFGANIEDETLVVRTSRGYHIYFFTEFPIQTFRLSTEELAIDVKGEGSYVLAPPSVHPSGQSYSFLSPEPLPNIKLWKGDLKQDLIEKIKEKWDVDLGEEININELLDGVEEGRRNNSAIIIASYYRIKGFTKEQAWEQLKLWNEKNKPPLPEKELQTVLDSAYDRAEPYHYRFKAGTIEKEFFTASDVEEAEKLLQQENILEWIEKVALSDIVGHVKQKVTLFLLNLVDESVHVHGESSTGKSYMTDRVFDCFPKHTWFKITGVTDKAIRYLDENIKHLYLAEWRAVGESDKESTAQYDIKLSISEGKLEILVVEKVEGRLKTRKITTSIANVISTTTDTQIPPELLNRVWEITTDKSLIPQVVTVKAKEAMKLPSSRSSKPAEKARRILRCAIELLSKAPKDYVIPYFDELLVLFAKLWNQPRAARDIEKLERLIYASALLHSRNRPIIDDNGTSVLVCLPIDFLYAWKYGDEAVIGTFTGETQRYREIKEKVLFLAKNRKKITAANLAEVAGINKDTAYKWLKKMENEKFIELKSKEEGKRVYMLTRGEVEKTEQIQLSLKRMQEKTLEFLKEQKIIQEGKIPEVQQEWIAIKLPLPPEVDLDKLESEEEEEVEIHDSYS